MAADAAILDRIDIRWAVRTKSGIETPKGVATAIGSFLITLGTYSGPTTREIMADNINARGVYQGDVESVECDGEAPSIGEAEAALAARGIRAEDIFEMIIQDVIVDDGDEIASSIQAPRT